MHIAFLKCMLNSQSRDEVCEKNLLWTDQLWNWNSIKAAQTHSRTDHTWLNCSLLFNNCDLFPLLFHQLFHHNPCIWDLFTDFNICISLLRKVIAHHSSTIHTVRYHLTPNKNTSSNSSQTNCWGSNDAVWSIGSVMGFPPVRLIISQTPQGVAGSIVDWSRHMRPTLTTWKPSTSFPGHTALHIRRSSMWSVYERKPFKTTWQSHIIGNNILV